MVAKMNSQGLAQRLPSTTFRFANIHEETSKVAGVETTNAVMSWILNNYMKIA